MPRVVWALRSWRALRRSSEGLDFEALIEETRIFLRRRFVFMTVYQIA